MNDPESEKAMRDAMLYGTGFMQDGKRIAPDDVYVKPDDAEALAKKLMSQVGDDVHHVYDHEALLKSAAATLRTQAAEIERLQEALGKTESEPQSWRDEVGAPTENAVLRREWVELKARAEKSEAERDALREALAHINLMDPEHHGIDSFSDHDLRGIVLEMGRQARAALSRETGT